MFLTHYSPNHCEILPSLSVSYQQCNAPDCRSVHYRIALQWLWWAVEYFPRS